MNQPRIDWREENGELWEYRTEIVGEAICPRCGESVLLEAETDEWVEDGPGRWKHGGASLATGECCGLLFADWWDGCFVYELGPPPGPRMIAAR